MELGRTFSMVGGGLLLLGLLIAFMYVMSILGPLTMYVFTYPAVFIGLILNIVLAIILFTTNNGVAMIVAGVLGLVFSYLLIGGIVGIIGGIFGLVGGILTLTMQPKVTRICPHCGRFLTGDMKFCPYCAAALEQTSSQKPPSSQQ